MHSLFGGRNGWRVLLVVPAILAGCAELVRPLDPTQYQPQASRAEIEERPVVFKNYRINEEARAYVGEAVVRVKEFTLVQTVTRTTTTRYHPTSEFTLSGGLQGSTMFSATDEFIPSGRISHEGKEYTLFAYPLGPSRSCSACRLLVDGDGHIFSKILNRSVLMVYTYKVTPAEVRIVARTSEALTTTTTEKPGQVNFEILFNGVNDAGMSFTYREYTPSDLARPAFTQSLSYPKAAGTIRFRRLQIKILGVTSEELRYLVVAE